MPDHTHIADLLSASGVPVTVEADRDHLVLSVGGLSAVFGLDQEDEFMQAVIAAWLEAEAWKRPGPEFPHRAYGVNMTWLGDEGGMAAYGHIPDLRFVAACNHLARSVGLRNIWDDRACSLEDALGDVIRVWAIPANPAPYGGGEWAITWRDVTEQTPGAIPVTVLWP